MNSRERTENVGPARLDRLADQPRRGDGESRFAAWKSGHRPWRSATGFIAAVGRAPPAERGRHAPAGRGAGSLADQPRTGEHGERTVGRRTETTSSNGAAEAAEAETLKVLNPATGETIANASSPATVAAPCAGPRRRSPTGRRWGSRGATTGSASCATGCSTTATGCSTRCSWRPARCAPTPPTSPPTWPTRSTSTAPRRPSSSARRASAPLPPARRQEAPRPVPAPSGGRHHQPLELPADPLARRRDPGPDGGRRGGHQALRVHARWASPRSPTPGSTRSAAPTSSTSSRGSARPAAP